MADERRGPPGPQQARPAEQAGQARQEGAVDCVRPDIRALVAYTTGEQQGGFIKLNTNECAYPPSPRVREALGSIADDWLRLYPDPVCTRLRRAAAVRYDVAPDQVIAGNGSDDCLTIIYRTFLAPGDTVACPWPSYGLYDTLAGIQGATVAHVDYQRSASRWDLRDALGATGARLVVVANPNNPSSTLTPVAELRRLADAVKGILVVDEAYVDFALGTDRDASLLPHLKGHSNLIVLRTFSKSYSLAGARLGLMFANEALIAQMNKVKDSYNVNQVTQALGLAALEDRAYHDEVIAKTLREKARLEQALSSSFGWTWPEARGNFLLCEVGTRAREILAGLHARKILVRYWDTPALRTSLRITVGNREQNDALCAALREIV